MSFIEKGKGTGYAAGWFLAHEECERKTKTIEQDGAKDAGGGAKYVPMGTVYPSNDENAIGIVYEDVDVSTGDMAGSVVTGKAVVYEDRLVQDVEYDEVTPVGTENPAEEGWYEEDGEGGYIPTEDTTIDELDPKTYYEAVPITISDDAKTALEALGFKFIEDTEVERPY